MSLQTNDCSSIPARIFNENHEKMSVNVISSSSATCLRAVTSSVSASPKAVSRPPVRSSMVSSTASMIGPMVASHAATKPSQSFLSLIRIRTMRAKVWSTSARITRSGSHSSSLTLSIQK